MFHTRTKIISTIGPACASSTVISAMIRSGMDAARLNFSHATHKDHAALIRAIRAAARLTQRSIPIIGDLQGPKIRLGVLPDKGIELVVGSLVTLSAGQTTKKNTLPIAFPSLYKHLKKGARVLIDDGLVELSVTKISGREIHARVIQGGLLTSHKGMNFPDSTLNINSFTSKDKEDALFGIQQGIEWFALSFVCTADQVTAFKRFIARATPKGIVPARVIAKIETHQAVKNLEEIILVSDGIMIARGDLGLEIAAEQVPVFQKTCIEQCRRFGKPVIVATHMLDSMIRNVRPTRAEVSDVANAVFDHTDCVMLSGETATGKFPRQVVRMMNQIIAEAEASKFDDVADSKLLEPVDGILSSHTFGSWTEVLLQAHPEVSLFLACPSDRVARQVALHWGVEPFILKTQKMNTFIAQAIKYLQKKRLIKKGMRLAVALDGRSEYQIITVK